MYEESNFQFFIVIMQTLIETRVWYENKELDCGLDRFHQSR